MFFFSRKNCFLTCLFKLGCLKKKNFFFLCSYSLKAPSFNYYFKCVFSDIVMGNYCDSEEVPVSTDFMFEIYFDTHGVFNLLKKLDKGQHMAPMEFPTLS